MQPVSGSRLSDDLVAKEGEHFVLREQPAIVVDARAHKMSKSRGNVVNPDDVVARYGADAFRLYEMFMGPLEQVKPWSTRGVEGAHRFLEPRVAADAPRTAAPALNGNVQDAEATAEQSRVLHQTIAKVTEDIEALRFNTAIAALMEFTNAAHEVGWHAAQHRGTVRAAARAVRAAPRRGAMAAARPRNDARLPRRGRKPTLRFCAATCSRFRCR